MTHNHKSMIKAIQFFILRLTIFMTYYIFLYCLILKHKSSNDPITLPSISGFAAIRIFSGPLFSAKCTLHSKMRIIVCVLSTLNVYIGVQANQKWCLFWKA